MKDSYNMTHIFDEMLSQQGEEGATAILVAANYLRTITLSHQTAPLFFKILKTNSSQAIKLLLNQRKPESYFSIITPSRELILSAFDLLAFYSPSEITLPLLKVLLGILTAAYVHSRSGITFYQPEVSDLFQVGKQLLTENSTVESLIVDLLYSWVDSGQLMVSVTAQHILDAYQDHSKMLDSVIPSVLLQ